MPQVLIELTVPEGTTVSVKGMEGLAEVHAEDALERYWREYLSENGRKIYRAAARLQDLQGDFSLEDIARVLSIDYESVRSMHRTSGRSARKWRDDTRTPEPLKLEWVDYPWDDDQGGWRTVYRLSAEVAGAIQQL